MGYLWDNFLNDTKISRHTVLAAGAGGLAGGASAGQEGNILSETSVTTAMIDWRDAPR